MQKYTMEKLKALFIIYFLLILVSLISGGAVHLIFNNFGYKVAGALLIVSSVFIITSFAYGVIFSKEAEQCHS